MALKIVGKICCGIDVHKIFVVICIASADSKGVTTYERHRFSTYTKGLKDGLFVMRLREGIPSAFHFQSLTPLNILKHN